MKRKRKCTTLFAQSFPRLIQTRNRLDGIPCVRGCGLFHLCVADRNGSSHIETLVKNVFVTCKLPKGSRASLRANIAMREDALRPVPRARALSGKSQVTESLSLLRSSYRLLELFNTSGKVCLRGSPPI